MEFKKRVGIWIRVSTDMQVKDDSPENHIQRAKYYIQSRNWELVEIYRLDAVSGKSVINHPESQRMLKDLKEGRISALVFSKLARLARSTKELLEFAEIFRKEGADLVSLAEQIDTSSPAGRLFFTIVAAMAEWEREEISSRVAASVPIRARMGKPLGGQASFGYKWHNKTLVIDEKEAPIRKLIYEIFLECQRKKTTARHLNQMGYRTRNGSLFSDTTIERLIRDTTAKGLRIANYTKSLGEGRQWVQKEKSEWITISCPAIIDEELWDKCNSILDKQAEKNNGKGRKSDYLLAGFVKCECGTSMYVYSTAKKFTCKNCKNNLSVEYMDSVFHQVLKGYLNDLTPQIYLEELQKQLKEKQNLLISSIKKRSQIKKRMDDLIPLRINGDLDSEHFATIYQPLVSQIKQLDVTIPELESQVNSKIYEISSSDSVVHEAKVLYKNWKSMEFSKKRAVIEAITEEITVRKDVINVSVSNLSLSSTLTKQHEFRDS